MQLKRKQKEDEVKTKEECFCCPETFVSFFCLFLVASEHLAELSLPLSFPLVFFFFFFIPGSDKGELADISSQAEHHAQM